MISMTVTQVIESWTSIIDQQDRLTQTMAVDQSKGYVLSEDIVSLVAIPHFNKSAVDGYAFTYEDGRRNYTIDAIVGAGTGWTVTVPLGHGVRIMTGAPVPDTCDTVVMQEQCSSDGTVGSEFQINGSFQQGSHIIYVGEECTKGTVIVPKGTRIDTGVQAVLYGLGYSEVSVYKLPRVLLLTSGREIIEPPRKLTTGKVYNSNRVMLRGLLDDLGFNDVVYHHINDDSAVLEDEIETVLRLGRTADIVISSGGVSVGLFDTMPKIFEALGAQPIYNRINMRPGAASYGAVTKKGQLIFGLSGNPGAAYNGWHLLVAPALRYYSGVKNYKVRTIQCAWQGGPVRNHPLDRYIQGIVDFSSTVPVFRGHSQASGSALLGLALTNGLCKIPKQTEAFEVNQLVDVVLTK